MKRPCSCRRGSATLQGGLSGIRCPPSPLRINRSHHNPALVEDLRALLQERGLPYVQECLAFPDMCSPLHVLKAEPLATGHGVNPSHGRDDSFRVVIGVYQLCQPVFFFYFKGLPKSSGYPVPPYTLGNSPKTPLTLMKNTPFPSLDLRSKKPAVVV